VLSTRAVAPYTDCMQVDRTTWRMLGLAALAAVATTRGAHAQTMGDTAAATAAHGAAAGTGTWSPADTLNGVRTKLDAASATRPHADAADGWDAHGGKDGGGWGSKSGGGKDGGWATGGSAGHAGDGKNGWATGGGSGGHGGDAKNGWAMASAGSHGSGGGGGWASPGDRHTAR